MLFKFFYLRMNKPYTLNNISISSFRNGFNHHPFSSTGFCFNKIIEKVVTKWKKSMLFNFQVAWHLIWALL